MLGPMNTPVERRVAMTLRFRLGVVALVFLAMVLIAVGLSGLMLRSWNRTLHERADIRMVADHVSELRLGFSDQQTSVRGFRLEGESVYLEPYYKGVASEQSAVSRLLAEGDEVVRARVEDIEAMGDRWRAAVAEPTIAGDAVVAEEARVMFEELRLQLDELDELVDAELIDLDEAEQEVRRNAFGVIIASTFVAIAGTALAASLFRRWVIHPLDEISTAARALVDDKTYPIPQFDAAELDDVSTAIGSLQRSLRIARDEALANYAALEQSAVLAIQVRSELADELGDLPDGWNVTTLLQPAEGLVAGDCFDVGLLDQNRMYAILIDVTGHGAPAALSALKAKSQLRAALRSRLTPGAAIDWVSREMLKDDEAGMLTAWVMVIDLASGRVRYANAGHPPAFITNGAEIDTLDVPGPLVGAFEATWQTGEADLPLGWTIVLYTDGITETVGEGRERFGDDRLRSCLRSPDPGEILECINIGLDDFRVGTRTDDVTAIALHRIDPDAVTGAVTDADDGAESPGATSHALVVDDAARGDHANATATPASGNVPL